MGGDGTTPYVRPMPTLHIETPITDIDTFRVAFDRLADARRQAGVREQRVHQPVDDPNLVVIDLEFAETAQAEAFLRFLETNVWGNPEAAPAQAGTSRVLLLEPVMS